MKAFRGLTGIFFLNLILVLIWFKNGLLFAGGEEGIPFYDLERTFVLYSYTWRDSEAGFPNLEHLTRIPLFTFLKTLSSLGTSEVLLQGTIFFLLMFIGTVSVYLLLRETLIAELKKKRELGLYRKAPLIGAIFYLLNPFSMLQVWGRGLYTQFFPFALFPLFLLLVVLALRRRNLSYAILALLASFFLSGAFGNLSYVLSLWLITSLYFLFYISTQRYRQDVVFSLLLFIFLLGGFLIIHSWWIYHNIVKFTETGSNRLMSLEEGLGTVRGISRAFSFDGVFRLIHKDFIFKTELYGSIYKNLLFNLISWIPPLALVVSIPIFKRLKHFRFYLSLLLITLFIGLGSNFPFGGLFEWLFRKFIFLQAFRNPMEKIGISLLIAYSAFFAIGIVVLSEKLSDYLKNKSPFNKIQNLTSVFIALLLFFTAGLYVWPMWVGRFAGGYKINPWVKVPNYYREAEDWLSKQPGDFRILHMPINPGDGLKYSWDHWYQGTDPNEYIFTKSSVAKNVSRNKIYYNVLLERFHKLSPNAYGPDPDISRSEFRSREFIEELAKLNIRFIILHRDIDTTLGSWGETSGEEEYISNIEKISKVKTFGMLDIYEVEIPEPINRVYSPEAQTSFTKINPTLYKVKIVAETTPIKLYFLEMFNEQWVAYLDGERVKDHHEVFSYANAWTIDRKGNYEVIIRYKLQDYVNAGIGISLSSVTLLSMFSIYLWRRRS